ncbi:MAG: DNA mismatch repair protein MutS [Bacteroidetes bacterium MedPE-SWsnd-G1]|nr:MAG: DNA mismatch repair protein MutS [Bacteroidetes bacterium MedPE-SWsnd-G1]
MRFKIGDKVAVLDDAISGVVESVNGLLITINSEDGFSLKFEERDLVLIREEQSEIAKKVIVSEKLGLKTEYHKKGKLSRKKKTKDLIPAMEVDLHIQKLVKSTRGMDKYDMLSFQIDTAKHKLEFAIKNRIPRIVFIHGVGEGVLKNELMYLLNRYPVSVSEASYQKYGMGATEVYILQNKSV